MSDRPTVEAYVYGRQGDDRKTIEEFPPLTDEEVVSETAAYVDCLPLDPPWTGAERYLRALATIQQQADEIARLKATGDVAEDPRWLGKGQRGQARHAIKRGLREYSHEDMRLLLDHADLMDEVLAARDARLAEVEAECAALRARATTVEAIAREAVDLVREMEWIGFVGYDEIGCPVCHQWEPEGNDDDDPSVGHTDECRLATFLSRPGVKALLGEGAP